MSQIQFLAIWWRLRPRNFNRSKWFRVGCEIHAGYRAIGFAFREPRFWWWCRRVTWHYRYGLPMPAKPVYSRPV